MSHSHTHTAQNRAPIVPEEANLTSVSQVMSSSAKQQHSFITRLHSLCASVCVFVRRSIMSLLLHSPANLTEFPDATIRTYFKKTVSLYGLTSLYCRSMAKIKYIMVTGSLSRVDVLVFKYCIISSKART